jgi:hypothetical protein
MAESGNPSSAGGDAALASRRKSVRLGRRFAGSLAVRLDAHPVTGDGRRRDEEAKILQLMREVLSQPSPDPCTINFLTQAVEVHTQTYGFSKTIHDELFRLHQARLKRSSGSEPEKSTRPAATGPVPSRVVPRGLKA